MKKNGKVDWDWMLLVSMVWIQLGVKHLDRLSVDGGSQIWTVEGLTGILHCWGLDPERLERTPVTLIKDPVCQHPVYCRIFLIPRFAKTKKKKSYIKIIKKS